jgi:glycosyltransferase involved in cell wall biosynthesis
MSIKSPNYSSLLFSMITRFIKVIFWGFSLQLPEKLKRHKNAQLISKSELFDTGYYWEQNPEVKQFGIDPLGHYLDTGVFKECDPNPLFDTSYYLEQYPDVIVLGINPLAHYITTGAKQNYKPHPLFDTAYYRTQYLDVDESEINPLLHYLTIGIQENRDPFPCSKIEFIPLKLREKSELNPEIPSSLDDNYSTWLNQNYPTQIDLQKMAINLENLTYHPLISIIMPVFNTPSHYLEAAIQSVLNQVYPNWELCIADDASTEPQIRSILENYSEQDSRIKICFRTTNAHISETSNSAIAIATGEFIALLDHDDLLTPHALYKVVEFLNKYPDADMIYSDEDKIDDEGKVSSAFFKPDWCPDSFLSRMYTCHLGVYRRSLVQQIGGFRVGYEGSQDYDLVLRLTEKTDKIHHIPDILYHWRIHPNSTAGNLDSKNYAIDAAKKALADALQRRNEPGIVTDAPRSMGHYVIRYNIQSYDLVSIIIPTKNLGDTLDRCLISIFNQTTYPNFEIILIDNGSTEKRAIEIIETWREKEPHRLKYLSLDIPFNYSTLNNFAVKKAQGKYLLFLNNDTEVVTPDWIEGMVEQAQRSSIGAVGALLLFPDDTIQHAGVIGGIFYSCGHSHKRFKLGDTGYFNQLNTVNNYSAVTGACIMCRREVFDEIEGFDETFAVNYNDIDLCFKMITKGYHNIYLPHIMLYHYEAKTRGYDLLNDSKKARLFCEGKYFQTKWKSLIEHDPCYNPNLTIEKEDYSFRV